MGDTPPLYYDPRCRGWYKQAFKSEFIILTDIYAYANGELGITDCVPLWVSDEAQESREFKGSYCFDVYATSQSKDQDFISSYY
jgi:hypothetical protein